MAEPTTLLLQDKAHDILLQAKAEDREENERMFKLVNEGNGVLSDANKRRKYDAGYSLEEIEQVRLSPNRDLHLQNSFCPQCHFAHHQFGKQICKEGVLKCNWFSVFREVEAWEEATAARRKCLRPCSLQEAAMAVAAALEEATPMDLAEGWKEIITSCWS